MSQELESINQRELRKDIAILKASKALRKIANTVRSNKHLPFSVTYLERLAKELESSLTLE